MKPDPKTLLSKAAREANINYYYNLAQRHKIKYLQAAAELQRQREELAKCS